MTPARNRDQAVEVVVVGAGIMGGATARALARAGREVVIFEQFEVGHRRGSSHGRSRIFRLSYEDPVFVRMAREALPRWRELEQESGGSILEITGGLDAGSNVEDHAAALETCGVPFERLDPAEVGRRFPGVSVDGPSLFQPDAGIVRADRAVEAMLASARAHGTRLEEGSPVTAIRPDGDEVEVETRSGRWVAPVAVVTAGAWAPSLLAAIGEEIPVRPTRETVAYFRMPEHPPVPALVEWGKPAAYALPSPGQGLKAGEHHAGPDVNPDEPGEPDERSVVRLRTWVQDRFPAVDPEPHLVETCLYSNTPDERFILERRGPLVIGSPCSGHGFKFAPVIGERLAALATA
ncbi:MAG: N-methyl-L-tryptophan oxidase [Actinomycetota bacterium]